MIDFFGDKMEDFHAADDFERQRHPIGYHDRREIFSRQDRRQRLHVDRSAAVALLPIGALIALGFCGRRIKSLRICFVLVQCEAAGETRDTDA